ncbi:MAG TPA: hypothetical protein VH253_04900 [Phycisphaerae bacterium]|nr:hypothetical protein [Phycisphaerae bacterium]
MKLAILSESSADEAAIRILIDAIKGQPTEVVELFQLRARGWPFVRNILPAVIKHLYYQTNADAVAFVVDSDDSPLHDPSHDPSPAQYSDCRFCSLRQIAKITCNQLSAIPGRAVPHLIFGIASPALEAWLLATTHQGISEHAWARRLQSPRPPFSRSELKKLVYGTDRPSIQLENECMIACMQKAIHDLDFLQRSFPIGFGALLDSVRAWHA